MAGCMQSKEKRQKMTHEKKELFWKMTNINGVDFGRRIRQRSAARHASEVCVFKHIFGRKKRLRSSLKIMGLELYNLARNGFDSIYYSKYLYTFFEIH